jgi:hypothetical protein
MAVFNVELRQRVGGSFTDIIYTKAHWDNLDGVPSTFTPVAHNHETGDINNLENILLSKLNKVSLTVQTASGTAAKLTDEVVDFTNGTLYMVRFVNGVSVANPTLNGVNIQLGNVNASTTTLSISGSVVVPMYYDVLTNTLQLTGSFRTSDSTEDYNMRWENSVIAGETITRYKIIMEGTDGRFYPLTRGDTTATTKEVSDVEFRINGVILQYNTTATISTDSLFTNVWVSEYFTTPHYTFNQSSGFQTNKPVYLVGTINASGNFVLDNTTFTSWLTQTLPTTDDGKVYIYLGFMHTTNTSFRLDIEHPIYEFKNGKLRLYETNDPRPASDVSAWAKKTSLDVNDVPSLNASKINDGVFPHQRTKSEIVNFASITDNVEPYGKVVIVLCPYTGNVAHNVSGKIFTQRSSGNRFLTIVDFGYSATSSGDATPDYYLEYITGEQANGITWSFVTFDYQGTTWVGLYFNGSRYAISSAFFDGVNHYTGANSLIPLSTSSITNLTDLTPQTNAKRTFLNTPRVGTENVVLNNDSRLSDARVASDVQAWAKAANDGLYFRKTGGELSGKLTIDGAGIDGDAIDGFPLKFTNNANGPKITGKYSVADRYIEYWVNSDSEHKFFGNAHFENNVNVKGNLTVHGTLLTKDTQQVNIGDNIIVLNAEEAGAPTENAGIEIERGTSPNVQLIYNETTDRWVFTNDGSTFYNIPISPSDLGALPITGGTLTGDLTLNQQWLMPFRGTQGTDRIYAELAGVAANDGTNENSGAFIRFRTSTSDGYGVDIGAHRRSGGNSALVIKTGGQFPTESLRVDESKNLISQGEIREGSNRVYSQNNNNIGAGATNYAAGNHNHNSLYLGLGGGTLTGKLRIDALGIDGDSLDGYKQYFTTSIVSDAPYIEGKYTLEDRFIKLNAFEVYLNATNQTGVKVNGNAIFHEGHKPLFSEVEGSIAHTQMPYATGSNKGAVRVSVSGSTLNLFTS